MLKTNVIKTEYAITIRNLETNETKKITVNAESLESAKLKIPDGWEAMDVWEIKTEKA